MVLSPSALFRFPNRSLRLSYPSLTFLIEQPTWDARATALDLKNLADQDSS
jgi:hypothetical protein